MDNSEQLAKKSMLMGNFATKRLFALVLASSLAVTQPAAAQNSELTPEQAQTVAQMKREFLDMKLFPHKLKDYRYNGISLYADDMFDDINPILVGRNVVYSPRWLKYIGKGKPLTEQQFQQWRDRADIVFDKYVELTGSKPRGGDKIYIDAHPAENFTKRTTAGHAHNGLNNIMICFNTGVFYNVLKEITQYGSWSDVLLHEMGHVFADGQGWEAESETMTNLLMAYALESTPEMNIGRTSVKKSGKQHRTENFQNALRKFISGNMEAFSYARGSAYDYYMFGLVDKVGWDAYKKAFRSYNDNEYKPSEKFSGNLKSVDVRNFFARLEYFSGKPGVLRTLPDGGKILDKYFAVKSIPLTKNTPDVKVTTYGTKPATNKTISLELQRSLRSYVNPKIEERNSGK